MDLGEKSIVEMIAKVIEEGKTVVILFGVFFLLLEIEQS